MTAMPSQCRMRGPLYTGTKHARPWRRSVPHAVLSRPPTQLKPQPAAAPRLTEPQPATPRGPVVHLPASQAPAAEAQQAPEAAATTSASQPARFSLYNWLRWAGLPTKTARTSASPAAAEPELEDSTAALLGDGMAAAATEPLQRAVGRSRQGIRALRRGASSPAAPTPAAAGPQIDTSHATLQLIRRRLMEGSRPGARSDGFKLGLVVEGGGMRGCVSGGALQAMHDLGMRDVFDAVYGSSAGAINSTYFLSGQREGVHIYHDHIAHQEFIDLKRLWKSDASGAPVLNLSYLIDHVMHNVMPLNWDAVVQSDIPLKVVASSLDALQPVLLENFQCRRDLATSLRASANVPEIAGSPVEHRGHRLVDAAVFEPVPFRSAIADGCTHVLVLCTRPKKERKGSRLPFENALETAIKRAILSPDYMVPAWKAEVEYMAKDGLSQDDMLMRSFDEDAHELPWFAGSHVFPLYPGAGASFSPLCTDVPTLKAGVAEGKRAVMSMARALLQDELEAEASAFEEAHMHESNIMPLAGKDLLGLRQGAAAARGAATAAAAATGAASSGRSYRLWGR